MIDNVRLWESVTRTAKSGTSGYQSADDFNYALASVQTSVMSILAPLYSVTRAAKDLLAPFLTDSTGSTNAQGVYTKPSDYFQIASAMVGSHPAYPVEVNELAMLQYLPSRRPDASANRYAFYEEDDNFVFLPAQTATVSIKYIRKPDEAEIILTASSTADSDYLTPTSTNNLEWPERAFNLFYYMMLQRFGIESKEQILLEFSNLGIQTEAANL